MSRFIDKLNQVSQAASQPIGFKRVKSISEKSRMQLIASLAQVDVESLADSLAGADAGLLRISELGAEAKTLKKMRQAVSDIPWGVWLGDVGSGGIKQLVKAGVDFVVFSATDTPLAIIQDNEVGKVLEVETSLSEGLLRAINQLSVDAVLVAGEPEKECSLTWHHLLLFQHLADVITKPLLVSIPWGITAKELQVLWEAGVNGVVVETGGKPPGERLAAIRREIDKITFSPTRKRGKAKALLPHIGREMDTVAEEE